MSVKAKLGVACSVNFNIRQWVFYLWLFLFFFFSFFFFFLLGIRVDICSLKKRMRSKLLKKSRFQEERRSLVARWARDTFPPDSSAALKEENDEVLTPKIGCFF